MGRFLMKDRTNDEADLEKFEKDFSSVLSTKNLKLLTACHDAEVEEDQLDDKDEDGKPYGSGVCTYHLLKILHDDFQKGNEGMSYRQVLKRLRNKVKRFGQAPQFSATSDIDLQQDFEFFPSTATGLRRAVLIGIQYAAPAARASPSSSGDASSSTDVELTRCHQHVFSMRKYLIQVQKFESQDIALLMDKEGYIPPTKKYIFRALSTAIQSSKPGDCLYLHFSGHNTQLLSDDIKRRGRIEEAFIPVDYLKVKDVIRDDELYTLLLLKLKMGVHVFIMMDCCDSKSIVVDLPYVFRPNTSMKTMELDPSLDLNGYSSLVQQMKEKQAENDTKQSSEPRSDKRGKAALAMAKYGENGKSTIMTKTITTISSLGTTTTVRTLQDAQ